MQVLKINSCENFAVISDVHLRDPSDELTQKFIATLQSFKKEDTLFLLGDIFDFIAVGSPFFFHYWENVFSALRNLKEMGTQIYFIEGNHDFGFEHFKSDFLENCFHYCGDSILEFHHSKLGLVHLRHGDNVVCKTHYLFFRSFVKNKVFQNIAIHLFPGKFMQFIFSRYAKLSRKSDKYRTLSNEFLTSCIESTLDTYPNINVLVLGHIHVLRDCLVQNKLRFLSGPDWLSKPNVLFYENNSGFRRVFI